MEKLVSICDCFNYTFDDVKKISKEKQEYAILYRTITREQLLFCEMVIVV